MKVDAMMTAQTRVTNPVAQRACHDPSLRDPARQKTARKKSRVAPVVMTDGKMVTERRLGWPLRGRGERQEANAREEHEARPKAAPTNARQQPHPWKGWATGVPKLAWKPALHWREESAPAAGLL